MQVRKQQLELDMVIHFTAWTDGTLAGVTQVVACGAAGMYYYLDGNVGEVIVTY